MNSGLDSGHHRPMNWRRTARTAKQSTEIVIVCVAASRQWAYCSSGCGLPITTTGVPLQTPQWSMCLSHQPHAIVRG